jgi:hypothetical protein
MSSKAIDFEKKITDFLLEEGILKEKVKSSRFDFGFIISYPQGSKSQNMTLYKPKDKNSIYISIRIQFSEKHKNALSSLKDDKKFQLFKDIRRYFLIKEVYFTMDIQNLIFEIYEIVYADNDGNISKDTLFKRIQKIYYCFIITNLLLEEYCYGKEITSRKLGTDFDLSLYS